MTEGTSTWNLPAGFAVFYAGGQLQATWDPTSYPEGYSVELQFLDGAGAPLSPQPRVTYSPGRAVVDVAPNPGDQYHLRARVIAPYTATQHVTVRPIGPVSNIVLDWRHGALHVTWTAPNGDGSYTYRVLLLDSSGQPVKPQPAIMPEGETGAAIRGDDLTDQATYKVSVQAEREHSLGPTTQSAAYKIDKSLPDSQLLRALLTRLRAADQEGGHSFGLSPTLIQARNITKLFGSLLGQAGDTLPVTAAAVGSTSGSVTLSATADYPFATGRSSAFTFIDVSGQLELRMAVANPGSFTVPDLITKGIIPASVYDPTTWADGLAPLPQLTMTLDSQAGSLTFAGAATTAAWSIPLGLANVSLGAVTPAMQIIAPVGTTPKRYLPRVTTTLTLGEQTRIPVYLQLPSGLDGWVITLGDPSGTLIGDLASFNPLMGGANSGLPQGVIDLGHFRLTQLTFAFAPNPDSWSLGARFAVGPDPSTPWTALNGLIKIRSITAGIDLGLYSPGAGHLEASARGFINGTLVINDTLTVSVGVAGPDPQGLWQLSGSAELTNFSLAALASYLGGSSTPLTDTLNQLGSIGSLSLSAIVMRFALTGDNPGLRSLSIGLDVASWTIPNLPWFVMDEISLRLDVQNPTAANRVITGVVGGILTLGNVRVAADVDFTQANIWRLQLAAFAGQLSGLDQIRELIPTRDITGFLPSDLPTDTTYGLGGFTVTYNSADRFVAEATFDLEANIGWTWLNGLLALWSIAVHLQADRASKDAPLSITGAIGGTVGLGGAIFNVAATKQSATAPWRFTGGLAQAYTVDFNAVLRQLNSSLHLPSGYGLPTAITVEVAELDVVPGTGQLDFYSQGTVDWSANFGQTTVAITALGGELHIPAKGGGRTTGAVNGDFSIGSLKGTAAIALGDGTTSDTVIDVEIGTDVNPSAATLVNAAAGSGTYEGVRAPSSFVRPTVFARAGLHVNLTKESLLLTGEYAPGSSTGSRLYGAAALLVAKQATGDGNSRWGFILAGALNDWRLADISPALSGVDAIIGLSSASAAIALSLLDEKAGAAIATAVPAIGADMALLPGLNFFARLDFTGGWLQNVAAIIALKGPYTILGNIPATTGAITLTSTLGSLRLFNAFAFNGIKLIYVRTPAADNTPAANDLRLSGDLVATLDRAYTFHGDLHVTSSNAAFQVATTNRVANPLGIPGITLDQLGLELRCDFAGGSATNVLTTFYGQVSFTSGPTLLGLVGLKGGSPSLVLVKLVSPDGKPKQLSISNLLSQTTGLTWPDALDVSLSQGQLWWVPGTNPVVYQGQTYAAGFHGSAQVKIFFLDPVLLDVGVYSTDTGTEKKGLVATAQLTQPVDWSFIKFAGTKDKGGSAKGPWVDIDTRQTAQPFGLGSAVNMLGADIGDVQIQVGKEKMSGSFTLPSSAGVFAGSTITFTWDKNGFKVNDWPLKGLKLPKFDLEKIKGSGACSKVIMESVPIDTKFDINASLSIDPPSSDKPAMLVITLNGSFNLVVSASAYKSDPLLTVPIANVPIRVPFPTSGGYDWSRLQDEFVNALKSAGESMINNLLTGPDAGKNWAKLVAVVGAKWAVAEMVDYLVCRGSSRSAAQAAVGAATGATAGSASVLGEVGVAVGGVIITIVGGFIVIATTRPDPKKPKPGQPGQPTLTFDTDRLSLAWAVAANAREYGISLVGDDGLGIPVSAVTGTATTVPASQLRLGQRYTARIVAAGDGGLSEPSPAGSLFLVTAPSGMTAVFNDPVATVTWQPVTGAGSYAVQVLDAHGNPVTPAPTVRIQGTAAAITTAAFAPGGTFRMQVRAVAPGATGPWGEVPLPIQLLPAPQGITPTTVGPDLSVTWQAVPGATGYAGQVLDQAGSLLQPQPAIHINGTAAVISGSGITDGAQLQVTFKGTAVGAVGKFAQPVPVTVHVLPQPTGLQLLYLSAARKLQATWAPVATASGYRVRVLDQAGQPLPVPPPVTYNGTAAEIHMADLPDATYGVQVQATAAGAQSLWCTPVKVTLLHLPAPADLALANTGRSITASWAAVPQAQRYAMLVMDAQHKPLGPQPPVTFSGLTAVIAASGLTVGAVYNVQVQALAPSVAGPYSNPVTITREQLEPPAGVQLLYHSDTRRAEVSWQPVLGAAAYELTVQDHAGNPLSPQPPVTYRGTTAEVDGHGLAVGTAFQLQIRGTATNLKGIWSEPAGFTPLDLSAPANLTASYANKVVTVNWSIVPGATRYKALVLDPSGQPLNPQPPITYAGTSASITATDLTPGSTYQVKVLAEAPNVSGPYSAPVSVAIPRHTQTALSLPKPSSNVTIPSLADYSFQGTGDFTFVARVRGTAGGVVLHRRGTVKQHLVGFSLRISNQGAISLTTSDASGNAVEYPNIGSVGVLDGKWHEVAAVRQTQNAIAAYTLYLDGAPLKAFPVKSAPLDIRVDAPLHVGSPGTDGADASWVGEVQQVSLWNTALNAAEIAALISVPPDAHDRRLVGYWPFTANAATDSSPHHNDGALRGGAALIELPTTH